MKSRHPPAAEGLSTKSGVHHKIKSGQVRLDPTLSDLIHSLRFDPIKSDLIRLSPTWSG